MTEQTTLKIDPGPKAPVRVRTRLFWSDNRHVKMQVWLNGDLITGDGSLCTRNADFIYLVRLLKPEIIIADREMISEDLWKRIKHLSEIELI